MAEQMEEKRLGWSAGRLALDEAQQDVAIRFGFRFGKRGTHGSRSMMLSALSRLLECTPVDATYEDYRTAILDDNVLGKPTASTRLWTWKKLRELYGLDPKLTVFRCLRQLWQADPPGRPLLALLCACARDPVLRMSAQVILSVSHGTVLTASDFSRAIAEFAPDRFSPKSLKAIGTRLLSSWTQSGHLTPGRERKRTRPVVTPETVAYALLLGRLCGKRGSLLFSTLWTELLDAPKEKLFHLAAVASKHGWINFKRVGSVVEVRFTGLLLSQEEEVLRESN